jgi:hypothetical protein
LGEAFERLHAHLWANEVDLAKTPVTWGAPLTFDGASERFTGAHRDAANALRSREYRAPYVVPSLAPGAA